MPAAEDTAQAAAAALDPAPFLWSDLDQRAVDTARLLALDAVERAGNGHPGTAMSLAPAAHLLFQRHLRHDPSDPDWLGRDRFVLSCGHTSLTLYTQLFLSGYPMALKDLTELRRWASATPGHPEWGHTPGVEVTTGPLGQGIGNAVGMAMAARRVRGLLDPHAPASTSPFDHRIWVLTSDGDMQEGLSHEAASLAGTQQLGNLVVVWDDNHISIDDDTSITFTEDVCARYEAYGWHVQRVDWLEEATGRYTEDVAALDAALRAAAAEDRPSFIALRTIIGWPAPTKQNTGGIHGAKAGTAEVEATKRVLGFDPQSSFVVEPQVLAHTRAVVERSALVRRAWDADLAAWASANPEGAALLERLRRRELPAGWDSALPTFEPGTSIATRQASGRFFAAVADAVPELWGGSADLSASNNTTPPDAPSFLPPQRSTAAFSGDWYGRVIHFGIREHAMGAVLNGIALNGLTRPYAGTFLVFSDYMRPSVRLAALMRLPVVFVWTHDSIGLGEDGPTHQPVEHLASLRAIPGLDVVRPADGNETIAAAAEILRRTSSLPGRPTGLCLTRQEVPTLVGTSAEGVRRGGYTIAASPTGTNDVVLMATGSEVAIAVDAQALLAEAGVGARVVSIPCLEWFSEQPKDYQDEVIPPAVRARVSVEAGIALSWGHLLGEHGEAVSLEHFGASAPHQRLYEEFGITAQHVAEAAQRSLRASRR